MWKKHKNCYNHHQVWTGHDAITNWINQHEMATYSLNNCQSTSKLCPQDNKMLEILSLDEVNFKLETTG